MYVGPAHQNHCYKIPIPLSYVKNMLKTHFRMLFVSFTPFFPGSNVISKKHMERISNYLWQV